ncbi:uncharacterized protein LOC128997238 isoform X1 [Macrosteles quadrilineatus]|uniref:uncharacterized protein LOC128997238 isoform X1 n=1 Tax=Macrosteles quadrilineatus TaxID=74068 RepID=UPI0023E1CB65|nr:uncharacterized protein LOC128997238 isoform X1 [Macrosteles quadrilineatus]
MRRNPPTTLGEVFEKKYKPVLDLLAKNPLFKQPDGKQKERAKESVAKAEVKTEVKTDRKPYVKELKTQDTLEYVYHPVPSRTLRFKVKASNDGHVILSESASPGDTDPVLEVFIGGWSNQKSAIRRDRAKPDKAVVDTPDALTNEEFRGFWINYLGGAIAVGRENEIEPFLTWTDPAPINVGYFGVCTGYGATGEWLIDGETIYTHDTLEYAYRPVPRYSLDIHVRASHNAHIALTSAPRETSPMYEVFLGGWENSASAIRYNREKPDKVHVETPNLLTSGEHKHFRLSWNRGLVQVKRGGDGFVLMEWQDPVPFAVSHFGVRSCWGAIGLWSINVVNDVDGLDENYDDEPLRNVVLDTPDVPSASAEVAWVPGQAGVVPANSVLGGYDNENLYVGRAEHEGGVIPGKIVSSHGVCYIAWGGAEHGKPDYEALTGSNLQWVPSVEGQIPPNAVVGGTSETGETLYIGRAQHEGSTTVGKVQPSHSVCYIPYGGQELAYPEYEILVQQ